MIFATKVQGIPCQCEITHYLAAQPAQLFGPPEQCCQAEDGELEFRLLDRKGYPAAWLERKMSPVEVARIEEEFHVLRQAAANDHSFDLD